jgi:hypothetical protein
MHEQHRTSRAPATLRVEPRHGPFLREFFEIYRGGRLDDLAQPYGTDAATLARIRAVADTCGRIIEGIDRGEIVADPETRAVLFDVAAANDAGDNDYERVVAEHEAFEHLLRQIRRYEARDERRRDDEPIQRALLAAVLDPPAYGGFLPDLARQLGESEPDTRAAAMALQDRMLATVREGYVTATGPAMEFGALCRIVT